MPALIGLENKLEEFFKIYAQKICPKFGDCCANLFVTSEGLAFTKGTLCTRLPGLWSRLGVRSDLGNSDEYPKMDCHHLPREEDQRGEV